MDVFNNMRLYILFYIYLQYEKLYILKTDTYDCGDKLTCTLLGLI